MFQAVKDFPQPKGVTSTRSFLGLPGYYRRFIQDYSKLAKPLSDLTKKGMEFEWGAKQQESFKILKTRLCEAPISAFPDFNKSFILTTDASDYAVGTVLSQVGEDEEERPIAYLSRLLNKAERNYTTTEKECLAVLYAMNQFRPYLKCK